MSLPAREIAESAVKTAGSFREAIQDLLVPELRALKVSMEAIRTEMQLRDERQTRATESLSESMKEMDVRQTKALEAMDQRQTRATESLRDSMKEMDQRQTKALEAMGERLTRAIESLTIEVRMRDNHLSEKLDVAMDIRDRLAQVEARLPKQ